VTVASLVQRGFHLAISTLNIHRTIQTRLYALLMYRSMLSDMAVESWDISSVMSAWRVANVHCALMSTEILRLTVMTSLKHWGSRTDT